MARNLFVVLISFACGVSSSSSSESSHYMDNVLIASYTENEHLDHFEQVFECFRKFKMKLKLAKCDFGKSEIQFLGHIIKHEEIRT